MKYTTGVLCLAFFSLILYSCSNPCKDVSCVHGTTSHVSGGCNSTCDTDYQGHNCDTVIDRIRFLYLASNGGPTTWSCTDSCNKNASYTCTIIGDPTSNAIGILNFANIGNTDTVYVYVDTTNINYVGSQPFNDTTITNING